MKRKLFYLIFGILVLILGAIYILPIIFTVFNSFKTMPELSKSYFALPANFNLENYTNVIKTTKFFMAFKNSVLIVAASLAGIVLISSMAGYAIARRPSRFNRMLYSLFVMGMILPFATIMIPTMKVVGALHMNNENSTIGLILLYWALGTSMAVFMFTGFVKSSVALEIEEAARIDGASSQRIFFGIVLPMIKPAIFTVVMLDTLWIWNDYLLPSLILTTQSLKTIPLSQVLLVSQYQQKWTLQFAGFTLSMLPLFILFFTCQKYIVKGVAAGSIKS